VCEIDPGGDRVLQRPGGDRITFQRRETDKERGPYSELGVERAPDKRGRERKTRGRGLIGALPFLFRENGSLPVRENQK